MFEFSDSENLIKCIIMIYRKKKLRNLECRIYKTKDKFKMILKSAKNCESILYAKEFSEYATENPLIISFTEEYEIPITRKNAILHLGEIFSRET